MMYIIEHVNVLLANKIHFALRLTVGGGVSKPGFRGARDWAIYTCGKGHVPAAFDADTAGAHPRDCIEAATCET